MNGNAVKLDLNMRLFLETSAERLLQMERALRCVADEHDKTDTLNRVYRPAHGIGLRAAELGFARLAGFILAMQAMLGKVRRGSSMRTAVSSSSFSAAASTSALCWGEWRLTTRPSRRTHRSCASSCANGGARDGAGLDTQIARRQRRLAAGWRAADRRHREPGFTSGMCGRLLTDPFHCHHARLQILRAAPADPGRTRRRRAGRHLQVPGP